MAIVNKAPDLTDMFRDIEIRLRRLESSKTFNVPSLAADPPNPSEGDMWINATAGAHGQLKVRHNGSSVVIHSF